MAKDERNDKGELETDKSAKKKDEAYKKLSVILSELTDRTEPVSVEMFRKTVNNIEAWAAEVDLDSEPYKTIEKEYSDLYVVLKYTDSKLDPYSIKKNWQSIKTLGDTLKTKLG